MMVASGPMFLAFVYYQMRLHYNFVDLFYATLTSVLYMAGSVCLAMALYSGKGGPIQSISSLSSLVPLFMHMLISELIPSPYQVIGIILGISGAFIVGLSR
jgi:uncharacterized membrane protein